MIVEIYECRNCLHSGPLNKHGRCEACGSDSVMSQEAIFAEGRFLDRAQYDKIAIASIFCIPPHLIGRA